MKKDDSPLFLGLTPLFDFGSLAEFEEEILTDREAIILGLTRALRGRLRGFSLPKAIMVRNIFCLYTFLFDPRWQKAVKVVRRRHQQWKDALALVQDAKEELRRLWRENIDCSHGAKEICPNELSDQIDHLPADAIAVLHMYLTPEHERYRRAARLVGARFGLSEQQVTHYIERDRLPYWPTVSVRVEPLEIPTLRLDISEPTLAQHVLLSLLPAILPGDKKELAEVARKFVAVNITSPVQRPRDRARQMSSDTAIRTWAIYYLSEDGGGALTVPAAVDAYCNGVGDDIEPEHYRKQLKRLLKDRTDFFDGIRRFRAVRRAIESVEPWKFDTYIPEITL